MIEQKYHDLRIFVIEWLNNMNTEKVTEFAIYLLMYLCTSVHYRLPHKLELQCLFLRTEPNFRWLPPLQHNTRQE